MSEIISLIRRFNKAKSKFHGNVDERIWLVGEIGKLLKNKESALQKARAEALNEAVQIANKYVCHDNGCGQDIAEEIRNLAAREKGK